MKNIIALGAENKTTFTGVRDGQIYLGGEFKSLTDIDNYTYFENTVNEFLNKGRIDTIACDMHPDYVSTTLAKKIVSTNKARLVKVQHHFAHIAACMLDNGINEPVIGVSFDGTGYGDDGASWGSEFLVCSRKEYARKYHLEYVKVPGGDIAAKEIWRMALSYLYHAYGDDLFKLDLSFLKGIDNDVAVIVKEMIDKDINAPLTSSMGRLFDAVAALVGVCSTAKFEAEGAIGLEKIITPGTCGAYPYQVQDENIVVKDLIKAIVNDLKKGVSKGEISAKFHNTIGEIILDTALRIENKTGIEKVLISGGCFQNKYLVEYIEHRAKSQGLKLFKHKKYPTTDLNISIGQMVVAMSSDQLAVKS